jgi:hypothetical protein
MPNPDSFRSSDTRPSNRTAPTVSGNRGSRFHCARVSRLRNPDILNSDSPGSLATRPRRWTVQNSLSGYRGFRTNVLNIMSLRIPNFRYFGWLTAGPSRWRYPLSLMCDQLAPLIGVSDFAISKCRDFVSTKSPIRRFPIFRWGQTPMVLDGCHLSHRWTALIVSRFSLRISRPLAHRVSDSPG